MYIHRTWFKVLFNPILRKIGLSIVSIIDENTTVKGYSIRKYPKYCKIIE